MSHRIRLPLIAALAAASALALGGCSGPDGPTTPEDSTVGTTTPGASTSSTTAALVVTSEDFADGGGLASTFAGGLSNCPGDNINPQLTWSEGPAGTASYAITLTDPDAATFSHWLHMDIPADVTSVARGASVDLSGVAGRNGNGTDTYFGPCPPSQHHYVFTVYALDALLTPDRALTSAHFVEASNGHILAVGSITGLFPAEGG